MLDSENTLHIRCGTDIEWALHEAGFVGAFQKFTDPFCQGPVLDVDLGTHIAKRAGFIAGAYGLDAEEILKGVKDEYASLNRLNDYSEVVLWFEHDSYDQLILAYLMKHLYANRDNIPPCHLICIDRFAGVEHFTGLGQLSPAQLKSLWPTRALINERLMWFGDKVWRAVVNDDPTNLHDVDVFPIMHAALERHLMELPSTLNGIGKTWQMTLQILSDHGPMEGGALFRHLMQDYEPLPYLGDTMYHYELRCLMDPGAPAIAIEYDNTRPWFKRTISLLPYGEDLLNGRAHWYEVARPERFVGGIKIADDGASWQWDVEANAPAKGAWKL
jgi:hypothetical protein